MDLMPGTGRRTEDCRLPGAFRSSCHSEKLPSGREVARLGWGTGDPVIESLPQLNPESVEVSNRLSFDKVDTEAPDLQANLFYGLAILRDGVRHARYWMG